MNFHILGTDTEIEIEVISRNYPDSLDYWDGNWVLSMINIETPGYSVHFNANLRTEEIRDFTHQLKNINKRLKGKAIFDNLDGFINIECKINLLGDIDWKVETCYPAGTGAVLHFGFASDQTYLESLVKELEAVSSVFPVIGEP